ncbi:MAG TPA: hypothetical protein VGI65_04465 [Steroidobacteraceae bacterium]
MRKPLFVVLLLSLNACVSGPPELSAQQSQRMSGLQVFKVGETPTKKYATLKEISALDCSAAPAGGRVWGDDNKALAGLKAKAAALDADAIVNASCGSAPLMNNCWVAQKCDGVAVKWTE